MTIRQSCEGAACAESTKITLPSVTARTVSQMTVSVRRRSVNSVHASAPPANTGSISRFRGRESEYVSTRSPAKLFRFISTVSVRETAESQQRIKKRSTSAAAAQKAEKRLPKRRGCSVEDCFFMKCS